MQGATGLLVVRDHALEHYYQWAQAIWYEHAANPMMMEAYAVRDAVKLAGERGYLHVEIESDAQEVVKLMNDPGIGRSEITSIVQEVKELSSFSFSSFSMAFVGRHANEAAHR